jgi:hypothetical protein
MEGLDKQKQALQRQALRPLGVPAGLPRTFAGQVAAMGHEAEILALPFFAGVQVEYLQAQPLQDADGTPYFMADLDPVDGGAPIL